MAAPREQSSKTGNVQEVSRQVSQLGKPQTSRSEPLQKRKVVDATKVAETAVPNPTQLSRLERIRKMPEHYYDYVKYKIGCTANPV